MRNGDAWLEALLKKNEMLGGCRSWLLLFAAPSF